MGEREWRKWTRDRRNFDDTDEGILGRGLACVRCEVEEKGDGRGGGRGGGAELESERVSILGRRTICADV